MHLGRGGIGAGAELDDDIDQQRQDEEADRGDDVEQLGVEILDLVHHRRVGGLEAHLVIRRAGRRPRWRQKPTGRPRRRRFSVFRQDRGVKDMGSDLANAGGVYSKIPRTFQILGGDLEGLSP